jgi:CRISPR/Cas system-associated protein Cas10 (large subunit of type III CRISPR-Cas system)
MNYLLKCDISGIQSFITDVKSDGAAVLLRQHSNYVKNLSDECLKRLKEEFSFVEIYKGGGNFYLQITSDKNIEEVRSYARKISEEYTIGGLMPYFALIPETGDFNIDMNSVNDNMQVQKLESPLSRKPYLQKDIEESTTISLAGTNAHQPKDDKGNPLDFDYIARLSEGDNKLAALKIDVDKLGYLFQGRSQEEYRILSSRINDFFDRQLLDLFTDLKIENNIYVVFVGGDDCFLIGSWDKILLLALEMHAKFVSFQNALKKDLPQLPKMEITFSAGIIIVPPKYPMIRLVEEAEGALYDAKINGRNSVSIFGHVLSWKDFKRSSEVAIQLKELVKEKGESKSLINRVKSSDIGYLSLQHDAEKGKINIPKVWRLKYYLRNVKPENDIEINKLFKEYEEALLNAVTGKSSTNPLTFPLAARWAELLLKEPDNIKNQKYGRI